MEKQPISTQTESALKEGEGTNTSQLQDFFEENEFNVHLTKKSNVQCAEIRSRTDRGVDMIIWLEPFTANEFKSYVNYFDVDETIDLHRTDRHYKNDFTISQSLEDFTDFHNRLREVASKLQYLKFKP